MGEEGGGGEAGEGLVMWRWFLFLSFLDFFISFVVTSPVRLAVRGTRKPHHDGDLWGIRSGGETGLCVYIAMIYAGRVQ